jgi:hypothetical protein
MYSLNIKLFNGDIFIINIDEKEIEEMEDYNKYILKKICSHNFDNLCLREHRLKVFTIEDEEYTENIKNIKNEDTLYIFLDPPIIKTVNIIDILGYSINNFEFNEYIKYVKYVNYFDLIDKNNCYDSIDIINFELYDKDIPIFINLDKIKTDSSYIEYIHLIYIFFNNIFDKINIQHIFIKCNKRDSLRYINFIKIFENYRNMNTLYIDILPELTDIIFNKINEINTENIYIPFESIETIKNISLSYTSNIYIFHKERNSIYSIFNSTNHTDDILMKFVTKNHTIFIDYSNIRKSLNNTNINWLGWFNSGKYSNNNIYIYKHISLCDYDLFDSLSYSLL